LGNQNFQYIIYLRNFTSTFFGVKKFSSEKDKKIKKKKVFYSDYDEKRGEKSDLTRI